MDDTSNTQRRHQAPPSGGVLLSSVPASRSPNSSDCFLGTRLLFIILVRDLIAFYFLVTDPIAFVVFRELIA
jgi:hypothetical protein